MSTILCKATILFFIALSLCAQPLYAQSTSQPENDLHKRELLANGQKVSTLFLKSLKTALQNALKEGGPTHALEYCHHNAPLLTDEIARQFPEGYVFKRTSRKVRNRDNLPDTDEQAALNYFEREMKKTGVLPDYYLQKTNKDSHSTYRFYKPLRIKALCITCHGKIENIDSDLKNLLKEKYSMDRAVDYNIGDLRGVLRVSIPTKKEFQK